MRLLLALLILVVTSVSSWGQETIKIPGSDKVWTLVSDQYWEPSIGRYVPSTSPPLSAQGALNRAADAVLSTEPRGADLTADIYKRHPVTKLPPKGARQPYQLPRGTFVTSGGKRITNFGAIQLDGSVVHPYYTSYEFALYGDMYTNKRGSEYISTFGYLKEGTPVLTLHKDVRVRRYRAEWEGSVYWAILYNDQVAAAAQCANFFPVWAPRLFVVEAPPGVPAKPDREILEIVKIIERVEKEIIEVWIPIPGPERIVTVREREVIVVTGGTGSWSMSAHPDIRITGLFSAGLNLRLGSRGGALVITCDPNVEPPGFEIPFTVDDDVVDTPANPREPRDETGNTGTGRGRGGGTPI